MAPRKTKVRAAAVAKPEANGDQSTAVEEIEEKVTVKKTKVRATAVAKPEANGDQSTAVEEIEEKVNVKKTKARAAAKVVKAETNGDQPTPIEETEEKVDVKKTKPRGGSKKKPAKTAPIEEDNEENRVEEKVLPTEDNHENDVDEAKSRGSSAKKRKSQQLTLPQIMNKEEKIEEPVPSEENELPDTAENKTKPRRGAAKKQKTAKEPVETEENDDENNVEEPVPSEENELTDKAENKAKPRRGAAKKQKTVKELVETEENEDENNVEEPEPSVEKEVHEEKAKSRGGGSRKRKAKEPVVTEDDDQNNMEEPTPPVENEDEVHEEEETGKKASGKGKERGKGKRARGKNTEDDAPSGKQAKKSPAKSSREKIPDVSNLKFDNESKSSRGKEWNFKISSWNVNGIRAWLEKNGQSFIKHEDPDVFCIQETKCSDDKIPAEIKEVKGYHCYWLSGDKEGYSGVGLMSKQKPKNVQYGIGNKDHDNEGRVITAEFDKFYVVNSYVPNAGRGLVRLDYRMKWDKDFRKYLKKLDEKKRVILCGDLNVSHQEIDLKNPKSNKKNAGFTQEERDGFTELLKEGFIDTFRYLYPDVTGAYTYWSYMFNARAKDVGWRLDYFVLSKAMESNVCDCVIRKDVYGSDHCPLTLFIEHDM